MIPFDGLTFCCTSIPLKQREDIASKISTLGGVHYNDLMSDVNYLIVGNRRTEKYKFCIKNRHDVRFIAPEAVQKVYDRWLLGEDALGYIDECIMPVFLGLMVCLSRVQVHKNRLAQAEFRKKSPYSPDDVFDATKVSAWIQKHGGRVTDSLTVSNSCVVTTEPRGKRYEKALEWDIPVVHPVWVLDSLLRNAALDCGDYALGDADSIYGNGCKVWLKWFDYKDKQQQKEERPLPAPKPAKKDREVWHSIMLNKPLPRENHRRNDDWDEVENTEDGDHELSNQDPISEVSKAPAKRDLFRNFLFTIVGFLAPQNAVLTKVISANGGRVVDLTTRNVSTVVIPSKSSHQALLLLEKVPDSVRDKITQGLIAVVTEWFVERSLFYGTTVEDRWGKPLLGFVSSPRRFRVCTTGFTGIELLHLEKLIGYMNLEYCDTLTSNRDLLVFNIKLFESSLRKNSPQLFEHPDEILNCPVYQSGHTSVSVTSSKNKIKAAKQWKIPVVSIAYIWESVLQSKLLPIDNLAWCLFAPGSAQPNTMVHQVKNLEQTTPTKRRNDAVQLPSPRRNSKRQRFGRIVGRGSPTVNDRLHQAEHEVSELEENDVTNIDELQDDVVGYQDTKSLQESEKLLRKLGG